MGAFQTKFEQKNDLLDHGNLAKLYYSQRKHLCTKFIFECPRNHFILIARNRIEFLRESGENHIIFHPINNSNNLMLANGWLIKTRLVNRNIIPFNTLKFSIQESLSPAEYTKYNLNVATGLIKILLLWAKGKGAVRKVVDTLITDNLETGENISTNYNY